MESITSDDSAADGVFAGATTSSARSAGGGLFGTGSPGPSSSVAASAPQGPEDANLFSNNDEEAGDTLLAMADNPAADGAAAGNAATLFDDDDTDPAAALFGSAAAPTTQPSSTVLPRESNASDVIDGDFQDIEL